MCMPGRPPRLYRVFQRYDPLLYFVTFNTHRRRKLLANASVQNELIRFAEKAQERGTGTRDRCLTQGTATTPAVCSVAAGSPRDEPVSPAKRGATDTVATTENPWPAKLFNRAREY
jgi:hypothetical protein